MICDRSLLVEAAMRFEFGYAPARMACPWHFGPGGKTGYHRPRQMCQMYGVLSERVPDRRVLVREPHGDPEVYLGAEVFSIGLSLPSIWHHRRAFSHSPGFTLGKWLFGCHRNGQIMELHSHVYSTSRPHVRGGLNGTLGSKDARDVKESTLEMIARPCCMSSRASPSCPREKAPIS